jgi:DNA (cytosine-5)-methyltransferase 1
MRVLDLFSGIGGFSLGLERAGMKTLAFCEADPFCRRVLRRHWPEVPIYEDVKKLTRRRMEKDGIDRIDLICGGFPCQPFSAAGRKRGTEDHRDLWPEMLRIIDEWRPTWVIAENVAHFEGMAFTRTKIDLESARYEVQPLVIPACAVGAPHRRDRIWIIAHAHGAGLQTPRSGIPATGIEQPRALARSLPASLPFDAWRSIEPALCRGDYGVSARVDRLKALGNAVVPQIVERIGRAITASRG